MDNFGWPCREGAAVQAGYNIGLNLCTRVHNGTVPTVNPHYAYRHGQAVVSGDGCLNTSGSSVSGTAFYTGGSYPESFDGAFFGDNSRRCIWYLRADANGVPDPATRTVFQQNVFPVDITTGPNGDVYYVDIAMGAGEAMTLSAWIRPTGAADWRTVLMKEAPAGLSDALYFDNAAGRPAGYGRLGPADVSVTGPAALPPDAWSHVSLTNDGTAQRLYVEGFLVATETVGGSLAVSTGALRLGGNAVWGEWFAGTLDDVRVYDRVLTAAEIAADRATRVS